MHNASIIDRIIPMAQRFNQTLPPDQLHIGDILETERGIAVIEEQDEDCFTLRTGNVGGFDVPLSPQRVLYRVPDDLDDFIWYALDGLGPVRAYLITHGCWKCHQGGVAFIMLSCMVITEGFALFRYPGARRQLREFFAQRPDVRARFGRVKYRFSKTLKHDYLSQGCPKCDALWGDVPLYHSTVDRLINLPYEIEAGTIIPAFELDLNRLFEEGPLPPSHSAASS